MIKKLILFFLAPMIGLQFNVQAQTVMAPTILAGHVAFVSGQVNIQNAQAAPRKLEHGAAVYVGDQIFTQVDSHLHLRMVDNAFVALRPASRLTIQVYDYTPERPEASRIRLDLQHGTTRAVTGKGGQAAKHQYRFNTPLAAIGLRGTDYTVVSNAEKTRVSVLQGGVIVTPLHESCTSAQLGPCISPLSRELTAGMPIAYVEISASQNPGVIMVPAAPKGTAPNGGASPGVSADDTAKENLLMTAAIDRISSVIQPSTNAQSADTSPKADNASIPTQAANTDAIARWGRWSTLVQSIPEGSGTINQIFGALGPFTVAGTNSAFALAYPTKASPLVPQEGKVNFSLVAAEAYLQDKGRYTPAKVNNGTLQMDFAQSSFTTQLAVLTQPGSLENIQAQGTVDSYGRMQSTASPNNAKIQGIVLNKALEATYLFDKALSSGGQLTGAAQWGR